MSAPAATATRASTLVVIPQILTLVIRPGSLWASKVTTGTCQKYSRRVGNSTAILPQRPQECPLEQTGVRRAGHASGRFRPRVLGRARPVPGGGRGAAALDRPRWCGVGVTAPRRDCGVPESRQSTPGAPAAICSRVGTRLSALTGRYHRTYWSVTGTGDAGWLGRVGEERPRERPV